MQLETDKIQLDKQLKDMIRGQLNPGQVTDKPGQRDLIPFAPCKHVLEGHRGKISKVKIHPIYPQVASTADDG
jgi:hypothetical protein